MANYPVVEKTWQYDVNIALAATGTLLGDFQQLTRRFKTALTTFATLPWTVQRSSDSITADGTDRWTADANLVWATAGTAHSWIVLRQTGIAANFEICIDLDFALPTGGSLIYSPAAGFAGGTTLNRPVAADEVEIIASSAGSLWGWTPGASFNTALNVMQSDDGQCTRCVFLGAPGAAYTAYRIMAFDKAKSPSVGWTNPSYVLFTGTGGAGNWASISVANLSVHSYQGASAMSAMLGSEFATANTMIGLNDISSEWFIRPVSIVSSIMGTAGRHGRVYDLWFSRAGVTTGLGKNFPAGGARDYMCFYDVVLPWDGTALLGGDSDAALAGYTDEGVIANQGTAASAPGGGTAGADNRVYSTAMAGYAAGSGRYVYYSGTEDTYAQNRPNVMIPLPTDD